MHTLATKSRWLFFALLALLLASCVSQPANIWLNAPGWSRGHLVGHTDVLAPILPARTVDGHFVFLLVEEGNQQQTLHFVSLDDQGIVSWDSKVPLEVSDRVSEPKIYATPSGFSVYWLQAKTLYQLQLGTDGQVLREPRALSGDLSVDHLGAAQAPDGRVELWFSLDERRGGLYRLDAQGAPQLLFETGENPSLHFDHTGALHVAWVFHEPGETDYNFFYALSPDGHFQDGDQHQVYSTRFALTSTFQGPYLGFDGQNAFIVWAELVRTGLSAGTTRARYTVLPSGGMQAQPEEPIYFPYNYHLTYSQAGDWQHHGEVATVADQPSSRTSNLTDFYAIPQSQASPMALALRARLPYLRNKESSQVGIAYMDAAGPESYQILSFTRTYSQFPTVQSDADGYLYVAWLEAASEGGETLYFASTAPNYVAAFGELSREDYQGMAIETALGLVSGLILIFLPLIWIVAPSILLLITTPLRRETQTWHSPGMLASLIIAMGAYWYSKLAFFPWITTYVPFSAWIPVLPTSWEQPLMIVVPILITLLALWLAWNFTFGRDRRSALFFTLIYAAVDGLLTIAIYGVVFYNAV